MNEKNESYRIERIERLLKELEYEVTRGMIEREIDETIGFRWYVPISQQIPNGIVRCEFMTRPIPYEMFGSMQGTKILRIVGGKDLESA